MATITSASVRFFILFAISLTLLVISAAGQQAEAAKPENNAKANQDKNVDGEKKETDTPKEDSTKSAVAYKTQHFVPDNKYDPATRAGEPQQAAGSDAAALAKKLANPLAAMISFPIQYNFDHGMGPSRDGTRSTFNIQPVVPFALNDKWNLISRTIVPVIHQHDITGPGEGQTGIGDVVQSLFFSPNKSEPFIWGVGPAVLVPTATNKALGGRQLGIGPTVVVLKQQKGWTVGTLWNHIWRVAGGNGRPNVNADFIQPFVAYGTKSAWTFSLNTESTYDWSGNAWSVPIHFTVAKLLRFGKRPVQFTGGIRCWATSPAGGAQNCGVRFVVTPLFLKK